MKQLILRTTHGSTLYGNSTPDSDMDWYEVWAGGPGRAKQWVTDDEDVTRVPLTEFLRQCSNGVPQALEAMYSRQAEVDLWPTFRQSWITGQDAQHRFLRTIKSFSLSDRYEGTKMPRKLMKRRHSALRLAIYMEQIENTGQFNPTLSQGEKILISQLMVDKPTYYSYIRSFVEVSDEDYDLASYYPELSGSVQGLP